MNQTRPGRISSQEYEYSQVPVGNGIDANGKNKKIKKFGFEFSINAWSEVIIFSFVFMVIVSGAFNRVAAKIMTQPMGNYSFFLSLFNSIMYVFLYFGILFSRYRMGIVTMDMLRYPWKRPRIDLVIQGNELNESWLRRKVSALPPFKYFVIMGAMDGLGNILGLIATPHISGPMTSLMSQTIIIFSLICALLILRTKYTYWQIWSTIVVLAGATIAIIPDITGTQKQSSLFFCIVMAISTLPNAISFTLKELVFEDRKDLDIFIVNSHSSLFQLLWWPAFLPITIALGQSGHQPFLDYVRHGFQCFVGITPSDFYKQDCSTNPYPYIVYISINIFFNIVLLILLKKATALLGFMAIKAILPLSVLLFYFDWPLLGSTSISKFDFGGLLVILVGLALFRYTTNSKKSYPNESFCCSPWLPWCDDGKKETKINDSV